MRSLLFAILSAVLLSGCGPAALPGPAKRSVTDADVLGTWSYPGDYKATNVEIQFTKDHRFTQTVRGPGGVSKMQSGTWTLDGASLLLTDILLNDSVSGFSLSAWTPKETVWWFTDEVGYLELYGGERSGDPDQCWPLRRLSGAPGTTP